MALKECEARSEGCNRRHHNQESCPYYKQMKLKQKIGKHNPITNMIQTEEPEEEIIPQEEETEETNKEEKPSSYEILEENLPQALEQIEKVNKRLEKAGITEKFEPILTYHTRITKVNGIEVHTEMVTMDLQRPPIKYETADGNNWEFVARLEKEEGGMMFYGVPGKTLDNWERPDEHLCEHCGKKINTRVKSYVLQDSQGETKQVGSTCLGLFLGIEPKGLWALQWEPDDETFTTPSSPNSRQSIKYDSRELLAMAYLLSDQGENYITGRQANDWETESTVNKVMNNYFIATSPIIKTNEDRVRQANAQKLIHEAEELAKTSLIDDIIKTKDTINAGEFKDNLDVLSNSERIGYKGIGTLSYLVQRYGREQARTRKENNKIPIIRGFVAPEGTKKLKLDNMKVLNMREQEGFPTYYNSNPTDTVITMQTPEGNIVKWKASNKKIEDLVEDGMETDATINISSSIVKAHKTWKKDNGEEQDQTWLKNLRFKAIPQETN